MNATLMGGSFKLTGLGGPKSRIKPVIVLLNASSGPEIQTASGAAVVLDCFEDKTAFLLYDSATDRPVVQLRLKSSGKVLEIAVDREFRDKVKITT